MSNKKKIKKLAKILMEIHRNSHMGNSSCYLENLAEKLFDNGVRVKSERKIKNT